MAHRNSPHEMPRDDPAAGAHGRQRCGTSSSNSKRSLRLMRGGAPAQAQMPALTTREDVVGVLVSAAADLLLRRISPVRAHEIEKRACRILRMFGEAKADDRELQRELRQLAAVWQEGRARRR